jgi:hypothetical protein
MQLKEIVPWGRNLAEYRAMFSLSDPELNLKILGCGDGPASFNSEMTQRGYSVISIDPIYQFSAAQIQQRVEESYEPIISQLRREPQRFIWKNFCTPDELGAARLSAMQQFLADYEQGKLEGRYLSQSLPKLKFETGAFELGLCSHLLFLYSVQLSLDFHLESIQELLRVCREVRIFPLLNLEGKLSPRLAPVLKELASHGFKAQVEPVAYEFQKGGNQMLRVCH